MSSTWGLSWGSSWGSAWGLFDQPYPSLESGQKVYVRSVLETLYVSNVVEQIVSVATINNISIIDATRSVTARSVERTLISGNKRIVRAEKSPRELPKKHQKPIKQTYAKSTVDSAFATETQEAFYVRRHADSTFVMAAQREIKV